MANAGFGYVSREAARRKRRAELQALSDQIKPLAQQGDQISLARARQITDQFKQGTSDKPQPNSFMRRVGQAALQGLEAKRKAVDEGPPGMAPSEVGTQPQKRAGVPLGVAEAFPEEAEGRKVYEPSAQGPSLHPFGSLVDNREGLPAPVQHALNTPVLGAAITEAARPANYVTGPGGFLRGVGQNVAASLGAQGLTALAEDKLPENTPGPVRTGVEIGAGLVGALAGGGAAHVASNPEFMTRVGARTLEGLKTGATTYRDITKDIPIGASVKDVGGGQADDIKNAVDSVMAQVEQEGKWTPETIDRYQQATGRRPTASMRRPIESINPPDTSPEGIRQGAGNAIVKGQGAADINLSNQIPLLKLFDALDQAKAAYPERAANVANLRSRQTAIYNNAYQYAVDSKGMSAQEATRYARGATRGITAESVASFTPLREVMDEDSINAIYQSAKEANVPTFTQMRLGELFDKLVDGTGDPTPSDFKAFEEAFGPEQMGTFEAKVRELGVKPGPDVWQRVKTAATPSQVNDALRQVHVSTPLDVGAMGRLMPTAGLYDPKTYMKSIRQSWASLRNPSVIDDVLKSVDENAANTLAEDGKPYLMLTDEMRDFQLPFGRGSLSETNPGLLGKIPGVRRGAELERNFTTVLRPQMVNATIENAVRSGKITAEQARTPEMRDAIIAGIKSISGVSNIQAVRNREGALGLVAAWPNWYASQVELIVNGAKNGSMTGSIARTSLKRLAMLGTALAAGSWLVQGKNPLAHVKDGVPQASIPGTGVTFDPYGPIGELIRHGIRVGEAGVKGTIEGGPAEGAGSAGHELAQWGRGMLSPLGQILTDLTIGTDYRGNPIRDTMGHSLQWAGNTVAPYSVQGAVQAVTGGPTAALGQLMGELGFRGVHTPSLTDRLNGAAGKMGLDSDFWNLTTQQRGDVLTANPDLADRLAESQSKRQNVWGQYARAKIEASKQQQALDDDLLAGRVSRRDYLEQLDTIRTKVQGVADYILPENEAPSAAEQERDPAMKYIAIKREFTNPRTGVVDKAGMQAALNERMSPKEQQAAFAAFGADDTPVQKLRSKVADQYYAIPRYRGFSAEEGDQIDAAWNQVLAIAGNGENPLPKLRAIRKIAGLSSKVRIALMQRAYGQGIPQSDQRKRWASQHPEARPLLGLGSGPATDQEQAALRRAL